MSESAAQRVFNLLDLVEIICEHTSERGPDGEFLDKKPLRSLALVNKVARHSAFRRLWRNVNGVWKIMKRVPQEREMGIARKEVSYAEELFLFFTDMIHSLHAHAYGDGWDEGYKLQKLAANLPADRLLFPHLRDLGISLVHLPDIPSALPLQNVRRLSLHLGDYNIKKDVPLMASIGTQFPLLAALDISNSPIGSEWTIGISAGIRAIPNLQKLEVNLKPSIIRAFVADLKHLRALRTLHIELYSAENTYWNTPDETKELVPESRQPLLSFRRPLDVLLTGHNNRGQISTVVSSLGNNNVPLVVLSIIMDAQGQVGDAIMPIPDLVARTYPSISHFTLQYYNINTEEKYSRNLLVPYHALLEPLLPLSNMVELDLRVSGTMVIHKALLDSIPDHWPLIQHCHFSLEIYPSQTSMPPHLLDVVKFASRCPVLRTLGIALDAKVPLEAEEIPKVSSKMLTSLNVGSSSIDHSRYAATLIRTAFPALVDLLWTKETHPVKWRMNRLERDAWKSVHRLVFS